MTLAPEVTERLLRLMLESLEIQERLLRSHELRLQAVELVRP